ncbi:Trm112 family protein [Actinocorallia sp. A-T 12471]|uniref:Trm112 family protein n=1 Tax=Actinocorallia sp. A-T 12471 TaxID=3089813 RepID=UPI0029CC74F1|nr:Trm112 family protein [Actinocorallia sp. A-T 12471]MDX6744607.1 Trm112 family protein [Actinocorallia sp. A-T 12471]
MKIDAWLLEILACPACRGALRAEGGELVCSGECGNVYPVTDEGVPVLLVDEARAPRA